MWGRYVLSSYAWPTKISIGLTPIFIVRVFSSFIQLKTKASSTKTSFECLGIIISSDDKFDDMKELFFSRTTEKS